MLLLPMYRVAAAHWPPPIFEQVYPDGRVTLRESLPPFGDDGIVRSRPLNAARLEFGNGAYALGYLVALRVGDDKARNPPTGMVWRPPAENCELGFNATGLAVDWVPCSDVTQIYRPNRMHLIARARLAFFRVLSRNRLWAEIG